MDESNGGGLGFNRIPARRPMLPHIPHTHVHTHPSLPGCGSPLKQPSKRTWCPCTARRRSIISARLSGRGVAALKKKKGKGGMEGVVFCV